MMFKKANFKKTKIARLTQTYEPLFLRIIEKGVVKKSDEKEFMRGVEEISDYVYSTISQKISGASILSPLDKKLIAMYHSFAYESNRDLVFEEKVKSIILDTIYIAVGLTKDRVQIFNKQEGSSFLVKYIQSKSIYSVISYFEKYLKEIKDAKEYTSNLHDSGESFYNQDEFEEDVEDLLIRSGLKRSLPEQRLSDLKHAIITKDDLSHFHEELLYLSSFVARENGSEKV